MLKIELAKKYEKIWVANFFHKIHLKEGQKSTNIEFWINSLSIMGPQNEAFEKMVAVDRRSTFWKRWSVHSYNGHVHRASRQQCKASELSKLNILFLTENQGNVISQFMVL